MSEKPHDPSADEHARAGSHPIKELFAEMTFSDGEPYWAVAGLHA
ncbi:hypothetical protein [Arthrobacter pityocampae]